MRKKVAQDHTTPITEKHLLRTCSVVGTTAQEEVAWLGGHTFGLSVQICAGFRTQHCLFLAESLQACNSSLSLLSLDEKWESSLR